MKKLEIWKLYQSIVAGTSQCHFTGRIRKNEKCLHRFMTGNEKHSSGGWYTFVCPHGLIYASRLLFLKESVRDAGMKTDLPSTNLKFAANSLQTFRFSQYTCYLTMKNICTPDRLNLSLAVYFIDFDQVR